MSLQPEGVDQSRGPLTNCGRSAFLSEKPQSAQAGFPAVLPLAELDESNGFRVDELGVNDRLVRSVSGAGDVNVDGPIRESLYSELQTTSRLFKSASFRLINQGSEMSAPYCRYFLIVVSAISLCGDLLATQCDAPSLFASRFEPASPVTYNDPAISGPTDDGRNLTRIEATNLDWLDLTVTFGLSTDEVALRLEDGSDELFGFRFASASEIVDLKTFFGLPNVGEVPGTAVGRALIEALGLGGASKTAFSVSGIWPINPELSQRTSVTYDCIEDVSRTGVGGFPPDINLATTGSFLVRPIP